jgi:hypothetical protein
VSDCPLSAGIDDQVPADAAMAVSGGWAVGDPDVTRGLRATVPGRLQQHRRSSHLQASGNFPVRNGNATGSLSAGPPEPAGFTCPPGQTLFLQSVTYSNTIVSDAFGHSIDASPDPISSGTLHVPA